MFLAFRRKLLPVKEKKNSIRELTNQPVIQINLEQRFYSILKGETRYYTEVASPRKKSVDLSELAETYATINYAEWPPVKARKKSNSQFQTHQILKECTP
jgi:hypothetical protein